MLHTVMQHHFDFFKYCFQKTLWIRKKTIMLVI